MNKRVFNVLRKVAADKPTTDEYQLWAGIDAQTSGLPPWQDSDYLAYATPDKYGITPSVSGKLARMMREAYRRNRPNASPKEAHAYVKRNYPLTKEQQKSAINHGLGDSNPITAGKVATVFERAKPYNFWNYYTGGTFGDDIKRDVTKAKNWFKTLFK